MKVKYWIDEAGKEWREIIGKSYQALSELGKAYQRVGWKTWLNCWDNSKWVLTLTKE